jgi:hypothetical protein
MAQCKDIPEIPILEFLARMPPFVAANWFGDAYKNSVTHAMPKETPPKLALAKMRMLLNRGLVEGCGCGCRGDFYITDNGRAFLEAHKRIDNGVNRRPRNVPF